MSTVECKNVKKIYDNGFEAVKDLNLKIEDGEFIVLLGPSGCGKSTTLMMLAGLETISAGDLLMNGLKVNEVSPRDRDIGMVFQNYALFPNLNVYDNIAYGLTIRKVDPKEKHEKVMWAAKILGLEDYLERKPRSLSGGQRQRVAIGRCIVRNPSIYLFDEPLSNLDAKLRLEMRNEIIRLHHRLKTTIVYVTHDQVEATTMADRIVVMKDGDVLQIDTPENIFNAPANLFVATFVGSPKMNIFDAELSGKAGQFSLKLPSGEVFPLGERYQAILNQKTIAPGEICFGIRPQYVSPAEEGQEGMINGNIHLVEITGAEKNIYFGYQDLELIGREVGKRNFKHGPCAFNLNLDKLLLFDKKTQKLICN